MLIPLFLVFQCLFNVSAQQINTKASDKTYTNPLRVKLGDPYVLYTNSTYYIYGTGARNGFPAYKSTDLVNWQPLGQVYTADANKSWGIDAFWAPEVYKVNGKYYMFYSAQWRQNPTNELENFKIGVAVSD
eukprot:gene6476-8754_t